MAKVFFNGKFVDEKDALIPVTTHALHYGTGCFEGIRAYYNDKEDALMVFRLTDHYKRMKQSAKLLFINIPYSVEELVEKTVLLVKENFEKTDLYIRPLAFKSSTTINLNLTALEDSFIIYSVPLGRYLDTSAGIRVMVSSWRRISDTMIPPRGKIAGSYVNATLAKTESALLGFDEALFLDDRGHIVEGSAENIFMLRNGTLITPPESDDILVGITRDTVIKLSGEKLGIKIVERSIDRSEIYSADEIFLVGTGAEITPVIEVDSRKIGTGSKGKISTKIQELYKRVVYGQVKEYSHWVTKVK